MKLREIWDFISGRSQAEREKLVRRTEIVGMIDQRRIDKATDTLRDAYSKHKNSTDEFERVLHNILENLHSRGRHDAKINTRNT